MRDQFRFNSQIESADAYLTKMAPVIDAIRNGSNSAISAELLKSIDLPERMEIEEHVLMVLHPSVSMATKEVMKKVDGYLDEYKGDYNNILWFDVYLNIHKFNNPTYTSSNQKYSLSAFVNNYTDNVTRIIVQEKRERSQFDLRKEQHVKRVQAALFKLNPQLNLEDPYLIYNNQSLANDAMDLSVEQIKDTFISMKDFFTKGDMNDCQEVVQEKGFNEVEQKELLKSFMKLYSAHEEYEQYIFRQSLYMQMGEVTVPEIACDQHLIDICKADPKLQDNVVYEKLVIKRPKGKLKPGTVVNEHVKELFIENTYRKLDKVFVNECIKREMTRDEIEEFLKYISNII